MAKENKNKEGKKDSKKNKSLVQKVKIRSKQTRGKKNKFGMTLRDIENQKKVNQKISNLISIVIILAGLFAGSLFVDVTQLVMKNGYSERALRKADVFELDDKTWVAYNEPAVKVDVLKLKNQEDCPTCNPDEILIWMKKFIPTMVINEISEDSPEGKALVEKFNLKTVPSFVFDKGIQETGFFQEEQVKEIFNYHEDGLVLNATALGISAGKYLEAPSGKKGDIVIGKKDAKVHLVTFFDFQCPYSKIFYDIAKKVRNKFNGDQLTLVYKHFPSDLNGQAISAALAGQCAYQQGRFEEMADILFANQKDWGEDEDFKIFEQYALRIGLNSKKFQECFNSEESKNLIQSSIDQGNLFGIAGTPSSFIGKEFLNGLFQEEDIIKLVNEKIGASSEKEEVQKNE